eukprot:TRINITY_DN2712_c0_g1_i1.p1 TRINITY_DN2712_c0_g1~~TRINITY_DN2712_c0_g1_i1.p1  ORF type:complete len:240 (-),score=32.02 TRINITY_DN2712_c0_g1_i1:57-776(-)
MLMKLHVIKGTSVNQKISLHNKFKRYENDDCKHEAAYDAYITGTLFAHCCGRVMLQDLHADLLAEYQKEYDESKELFLSPNPSPNPAKRKKQHSKSHVKPQRSKTPVNTLPKLDFPELFFSPESSVCSYSRNILHLTRGHTLLHLDQPDTYAEEFQHILHMKHEDDLNECAKSFFEEFAPIIDIEWIDVGREGFVKLQTSDMEQFTDIEEVLEKSRKLKTIEIQTYRTIIERQKIRTET